MSDYTVREIALSDDEAAQVTSLVNASFPDNLDFAPASVRRTTATQEGDPSIYLAARTGGEIVGFNAFISHKLWLNNEPVAAYQSCWTATSDQHRGKGIFQALINAGREIMRARGTAFLFGYPNSNSYPIMLHKLRFRELASVKWQAPLARFALGRWLSDGALDRKDAVLQDERQLIDLKRAQHGDAVVEFRAGDSLVWGFRRIGNRFGLSLPVFEIGGIDLRDADDLWPIFNHLSAMFPNCLVAQFMGNENNSYNVFFKKLAVVRPPLMVDDLALDTRGLRFNFYSGVRDYF